MAHNITFIKGDGIGEEVTSATRKIIDATGVKINWEDALAGAQAFKQGIETGVPQSTIDSIMRNKVVLKGPLETPVGFGQKSANVTLRKMFETFGNIRPVKECPGVITPFSGRGVDLVIVRENVEDLYAGIEYMQTPGVAECLKLISRKGCEKIVRLAFEFARSAGRKSVACATKANIMKLSEGLVKRTFEEIATDYPDINSSHVIIDNCAHLMVKFPEQFDVIVTTNMNGDILSDLGSGLIGGLGFAPGANIGEEYSIFEAVHGSAPKYAGLNKINPTAMLFSGVMMLRHLGEFKAADAIENAVFVTLGRDKCFTRDVMGDVGSVSTTTYTDKIISNLGEKFDGYESDDYTPIKIYPVSKAPDLVKPKTRRVDGIDIFLETTEIAKIVGKKLDALLANTEMRLKLITCRGVVVDPLGENSIMPDVVDALQCRLVHKNAHTHVDDALILKVLEKIQSEFSWGHIEKLHTFDDIPAYSKSHGEG
ncbi:MAG TPA: NADP-dependent isocitrate dehydrogenase [Holosporales bacterium]|nr:NADP-dependent isocitrate dehydrogenase [Holosporales bacterium]